MVEYLVIGAGVVGGMVARALCRYTDSVATGIIMSIADGMARRITVRINEPSIRLLFGSRARRTEAIPIIANSMMSIEEGEKG